MAFALDDRVRETSTTTGTGTLDLDGAVSNFQTFVAGIGSTNTTHYAIINRDAAEWEVGLGTVTDAAPDTLARTTVFSSSNGDAAVSFSAGTKDVICTRPAGTVAAALLVMRPETSQNITVASAAIISTTSHIELTSDADYLLTSTPSIVAGQDGQMLYIHNGNASDTVTIQDDSVLAGSDVHLGGASGIIKPMSTMTLQYHTDTPAWSIISNPNEAAIGATASVLNVRNTSGSSIAGGSPVYITGYNTGLNLITIDLADANDAAKMPAVGITSAAIGNNANGTVITSGIAEGQIDCVGQAVGDGIWVSTTAGAVVFVRPSVDNIQRIGTVAHVAQDVVHIFGAGRANDIPIIVPAHTLGGTISGADQEINRVNLKDYGEVVSIIGATGGGAQTIYLELGNVVSATQDTGTTTYTFSNPPASGTMGGFTFFLTNGASNGGTVWPGSVDWDGGNVPSLTAAGVDVLVFETIDGGTIWYGFAAGLDFS